MMDRSRGAMIWMMAAVATAALNDVSSARPPFVEVGGLRVPESVLTVISVDLENVSLESALAAIAAKGDFDLSYNRSRIPVGEKVTVRMEEVRALEALSWVLEETDTELAVTSDGQLAVVPSAAPDDRRAQSSATLSGFIRDSSDGEHLPNATVAVGDREMGTLSNAEGYYAPARNPGGDLGDRRFLHRLRRPPGHSPPRRRPGAAPGYRAGSR